MRRAIAADRSANDIAKQVTMTRKRGIIITTIEEKWRVTVTTIFLPEPDERKRHEDRYVQESRTPEDHAVTGGFDESLHCDGGHSPEYHIVALENSDEQQKQRFSQTRPQKRQNALL